MSMIFNDLKESDDDFCFGGYMNALPVQKKNTDIEELKAYRAIGTVSEFRELKEKATAIKSDGFSDHLLNMGYTKGMKDGYAKAIEEFAERIKAEIANCSWQFSRLEAETIDKMAISIVRGKE